MASKIILHNKPKTEVHPGHKLTGPIEEEVRYLLPGSTSQ